MLGPQHKCNRKQGWGVLTASISKRSQMGRPRCWKNVQLPPACPSASAKGAASAWGPADKAKTCCLKVPDIGEPPLLGLHARFWTDARSAACCAKFVACRAHGSSTQFYEPPRGSGTTCRRTSLPFHQS